MALIWLPVLMIINIALALGLGLGLGVLNVFMRDIGQIVPVIMQFLGILHKSPKVVDTFFITKK